MTGKWLGFVLAVAAQAAVGPATAPAKAAEAPSTGGVAGAVKFADEPKAVRVGEKVKIAFTASAATDVEVAILDRRGKVVRHLAAGVLGRNAPAPLKKGSPAQSLLWDGKDDAGRPLGGGEYRVRVRLGLQPKFDGLIGAEPAALGSVRALATGPKGEVYVFHVFGALHPSDGSLACSVLSREGKYLRTILPYPASLPDVKLAGLRRVERKDGRKVPFIYQAETRSLVPGAGDLPPQRAVATRDGRVAFVGVQEWAGGALRYAQAGAAQVVAIGSDGSAPPGGVLRTLLSPRSSSAASLALSPDEKTLYATGLREGSYQGKPTHAVYRFGWDDKTVQVFAGKKAEAGSDETHLSQPMSVATDKDGTVYVADKGNDRVVVLKPDGTFLGSFSVAKPERVEVHPRSGAVYVLGGARVNELHKYASWKAAEPSAKVKLPFYKHKRYTAVMALDASGQTPVLWVGSPMGYYARFRLLRIEDRGEAFGPLTDVAKPSKQTGAGAVTDVSLDPLGRRLYTSARRNRLGPLFDARTGKPVAARLPTFGGSGTVATLAGDGNFYVFHSYPSASVSRLDGAFRPLPFAAGPRLDGLGSARLRGRGLTADRQGNVYVLYQKPKDKLSPGDARDANALAVYGPDGKLKNAELIDSEIRSLSSVRVDASGSIYLAVGVRPPKKQVPDDLARVPRGRPWKYGMSSTEMDWYTLMYGCIVKFGPEGGKIRSGIGGTPVVYGYGNKTRIQGARWMYFGASCVPSWRTKGTPDVCLCESPRFDVDGFGRSFFPDAGRFRVGVIDAAGNEICAFGSYGNQDSAGPGSAVPTPEIPLCWPHAIAAGDEFIYVGDRLNRRVIRVRLAYAAEALCPVPR